jgi:hypothetical protein
MTHDDDWSRLAIFTHGNFFSRYGEREIHAFWRGFGLYEIQIRRPALIVVRNQISLRVASSEELRRFEAAHDEIIDIFEALHRRRVFDAIFIRTQKIFQDLRQSFEPVFAINNRENLGLRKFVGVA